MQLSRLCALLGATSTIALGGCLNDYGEFEFSDRGTEGGAGSGAGGSGGSAAAAPCRPGQQRCDGQCVSLDHREHCGGCGNDCSAQGFAAGFVCVDGRCGCGLSQRCGAAPAQCRSTAGACECGGGQCRRGEACKGEGATQTCSCNGEAPCGDGETCCPPPKGCSPDGCG